ncbi:MAG: VWA domain-containing protein [Magnetospirillum sp. WYHS-4]
MIRLVLPWIFLLLPLPWLVRQWAPAARRSPGVALRVPFFGRLRVMAEGGGKGLRRRWLNAAHLVWLLLLSAAAQPQWVGDSRALPSTGRDLMLAIDISGSMRTMDFEADGRKLDRLAMVKRVGSRFVEGRGGDRLGLILFGAQPYLRAPLSHDHNTVKALLEEAEIALAGEYTALGDAIGLAIKRMRERPAESRVIVALTDGASNAGAVGPRQAARMAAELGIRVYTIGVGREDVAAPNPFGVWSTGGANDFNREVLEAVARETGGVYFHALDAQGLREAYARLDELEPALGEAIHDYTATPLYPWPLAVALALSLGIAWRGAGRRRGEA